ncbi:MULTISPECIES: CBS domain-containing protein [Chromohalobacter]|uniref:CBS domain containing membrane protein n=1 Tax=Chromohalobacter israelensis (strain ATCC BAA-138 / DSM 3043 / CIP 106854 / NCIMB 13768 / 1H11) TaxID=290398 RepID=Q1QY50_CHRI1|nr:MULTISPECIES: CBS domain-containing protein [Chromohalobacter]ABE58608.1 CBS domain containing membrane protein [Chromohalobacter salexigens DSM 3043]MBZ5875350.1 CBS domain-containing protein [Chromohalobacter salexigens]MDF9433081.1 CBS domain-containing protein [Chromohalobacter israelensis]MDO0944730.1 CBS domain-containing protein [Chromohalobacter salexigens]NQY44741.1 CBS domain-containing protein [Chromohalobacter sp.]
MTRSSPAVVGDIMLRDGYRVTADTSISTLADGLARHRLPGAPVVDANDRLIGFISEQDVLGQLLDSAYHCGEPSLVGELMREVVLTVTPDKSIVDLAESMRGERPKVYPVVDEGHVVGLVTRREILAALLQMRSRC